MCAECLIRRSFQYCCCCYYHDCYCESGFHLDLGLCCLPGACHRHLCMSFLIWEGLLLPHQYPAHQPLPTECGNAEGMAWSLFLILAFFTQLSLIRNRSPLATRQGNTFAKEEGLPLLSHALGCQLFPICLTCRALGQTY